MKIQLENLLMHQTVVSLYGRLQHWQDTARPLAKAGWICAGYAAAAMIAAAGVVCHVLINFGPGEQNYSGMYAFGDSLLFLAAFAIASIPSTVAALFFLRPYPAFWRACSGIAAAGALIGIASSVIVITDARSLAAGIAFLCVIAAPLFGLAFGLCGFFAPNRNDRISLFAAAATDIIAFAAWVIACLIRNH